MSRLPKSSYVRRSKLDEAHASEEADVDFHFDASPHADIPATDGQFELTLVHSTGELTPSPEDSPFAGMRDYAAA